jgi:hypothetical protein
MTDKTFKAHNGHGTTDSTTCKSEALRYATELGWYVFPAPPGKKKSHKKAEHSNGAKWGMTNDPDQIERDFKKWPDANVGIPAGIKNGFFVIDADTLEGHKVDGIANLQTLVDANSPLPETRQSISPTGSIHYYFKYPQYPDGMKVKSNDTGRLAAGVDILGEGGMVLGPPSVKPGVGTYEWLSEVDIAEAPQWLLDLVIVGGRKRRDQPQAETQQPPHFEAGQQADILLIAALTFIPNNSGWSYWKQEVGMRVWARTNGSAAGLAAFTTWSRKSPRHSDIDDAENRLISPATAWEEMTNSPPTEFDADSILRFADTASPEWRWRYLLLVPWRDNLLSAFLNEALHRGVDDSKIINACLDEKYSGNGIFEHVKENGGEEYLKKQIATLLNEAPAATGKAIIRCRKGERHIINDKTQAALIAAKCPVFYRGGVLVEPLWRWEKTSEDNREALATSLVKLNPARLSYMASKHAAIYSKYNARDKRWDAIDPPKEMIEQLLDLGHWGFPTIKGIINSPTMRPDGSLLTDAGYDKATQLWYKSSGDIELPDIPDLPTKEDAQAALRLLVDLLAGFPFRDDDGISEAVAIAGLMTVVLRGAFEFAPLFLILAPEPGSGKSYLVQTIGTLATGRAPVPVPMTEDKNEMDKRLSAVAFGAKPILHLNNLDFDLESSLLNQMITEGIVEIRPFGKNDQTITCDCRGTTIFANGNNVRIVGDLVRRTLTAQLDAKSETPETRKFKFDPVDYVKADRGKYLAAVFTIVRGYMAAGCPKMEASPLAGFDSWTRMVRHPLIWLGMTDPVKSMEGARALDPERSALRQRIDGLAEAFGINQHFTAAQVQSKATAVSLDGNGNRRAEHPELLEGFLRSDGRPITSKSIGNQLIKDLDRVMGGRWIERVVEDKHGNQYQVCGDEPSM